jgi:hypothetical protein
MVINAFSVVGQTLGVWAVSRLSYGLKLQLNLITMIAVVACLPYVVRYIEGEFIWIFSNCLMAVIGNY